ncbi:MAG: PLP-dependent transferase [Clostridia bacterium]|nr:PLP-dependent transferase [Clostridia bacterium]
METPICDFVRRYAEDRNLRLHMPGHKGVSLLGFESYDITEIQGADSLYEADGIIKESEENASALFGAHTFYSTEGSSLCIRAMLYLVAQKARERGEKPLILAGRNVHKSFLSAVGLLDLAVEWLYGAGSYLSCSITPTDLDRALTGVAQKPVAVYLTSPDYLGNTVDVAALAAICHARDVLLLVDNAHGAYLKFLPVSRHPIDLGADLCCDSAHKTLPALTGGAYLHISHRVSGDFAQRAKDALALFGSTSPSYLILQSLDAVNAYLADGYAGRLAEFVRQVQSCKQRLAAAGYALCGDEPLKLTIRTKPYGYRGGELADLLLKNGIVCEFYDPDHVVFMLTPQVGSDGLCRLTETLCDLPGRAPVTEEPPRLARPKQVLSAREAILAPSERLPAEKCLDRILAVATVGCPPAVPIVCCGERIDESAIRAFRYYGVTACAVVKP